MNHVHSARSSEVPDARAGWRVAAALAGLLIGAALVPDRAQGGDAVMTRWGSTGASPTIRLTRNGDTFVVSAPQVGLNGNHAVICPLRRKAFKTDIVCLYGTPGGNTLFEHDKDLVPIEPVGPLPVPADSITWDGVGTFAAHGEGNVVYIDVLDLPPSPNQRHASPNLVTPPSKTVAVPGVSPAFSTQSLAFHPITGRSYVCHSTGISVVDPPYLAVSFTLSLPGCTGVATAPDGSVVAAVNLSNQMFIYPGPVTAGSAPQTLTVAAAPARFEGLVFAMDGSRIVTAALDTPDIFIVSPPYGSGSDVQHAALTGIG